MAKLAIKGHASRGKEIIEILKMLGGKTHTVLHGDLIRYGYYIDSKGFIEFKHRSEYDFYNDKIYSLEEFMAKYPYKVGDKVVTWVSDCYYGVFDIQDMSWSSLENEVKYKIHGHWHSVRNLQPYKEEETIDKTKFPITMEEQIKIDIPKGYKFANVDNQQVILEKIKPQYPKTYEECCNILGVNSKRILALNWRSETVSQYELKAECLFTNLYKLKICRDAYWKIAGEQMGLGKPWEPDWDSLDKKYNIYNYRGVIKYDSFTVIDRCLLVFPTEEMPDVFYENFKCLIEECKEFL